MEYRKALLGDKIHEMYPEIAKHGISMTLDFDEGKNAYIVKLRKDSHESATQLEKRDAEDCMNNVKCVYFDEHIRQFIKKFVQ